MTQELDVQGGTSSYIAIQDQEDLKNQVAKEISGVYRKQGPKSPEKTHTYAYELPCGQKVEATIHQLQRKAKVELRIKPGKTLKPCTQEFEVDLLNSWEHQVAGKVKNRFPSLGTKSSKRGTPSAVTAAG